MALVKKLSRLLTEEFPPPDQVELKDEDGIIGEVTSKRFRRLNSVQRQSMIHKLLKEHLTPEEMRRVVIILTLTPEEEKAHKADAAV